MMRDDHYGWFERLGPGVYGLTETGRDALAQYRTLQKPPSQPTPWCDRLVQTS